MSAREKFRIGQRVALSAFGEEQRIRPRSARTGTVVGFSRDGECVRVRWDGTKLADGATYPDDFVENIEPEPSA